ncbi:M20 family metallopeptidase [Halorussus litoreus]|uniref:M20 family metallopeptidase n=1 Tax=Halorussus litoreus TaxID=1710536 RepID=UPI00130051B6|nr:ArgE/DapE family deacylase [Halorussus litoreus]
MTTPNPDDSSASSGRPNRSEIADLAAALVSIPTENPPGNERACAEFVVEWFAERGIDARLVEKPDPDRAQAVAWVGDDPTGERAATPAGERADSAVAESARSPADGRAPDATNPAATTLVLNGHLDVVPAGDRDQWSHDPFAGTIEDGRLYGRGSADMKTNLALGMLTLRDLAPAFESGDLDGSLVFHAAMGEETGHAGTQTFIEEGYGGDLAVVLEPTDFRVGTSAKGVATYRIGVAGSASHASRPDQGTNAIDAARPVFDAVDDYDATLRERADPLVGQAYATVTEFEAGTDSNMGVIPERAEFLLDRRVLPDEEYEDVEAEVEALLANVEQETRSESNGGVETDLSLVQYYAAAGIDADHPLAERFRDLSVARANAPAEPWGLEAATDAREFVAAGTPAIIWGPGELAQAHTVDESVDLDDAALGLDMLKEAVEGVLSDS